MKFRQEVLFRIAAGCLIALTVLRVFVIVRDLHRQEQLKIPLSSSYSARGFPRIEVVESVVLTADGGESRSYAIDGLNKWLQHAPKDTSLLFLGDNAYPRGIPNKENGEKDYERAVRRLFRQITPFKDKGINLIFTPGNHDWDFQGSDGWGLVLRQQQLIDDALGVGHFLPRNGCPGPALTRVTPHIQFIALDSQWWFHEFEKPQSKADGCEIGSEQEGFEALQEMLKDTSPDIVTIVGQHHPILSYGHHGLSSHCPGNSGCPRYGEVMKQLTQTLKPHPPLICAAGHDHTLQILEAPSVGCRYNVVSGALTKPTDVILGPESRFATSSFGFIVLERSRAGDYQLVVISTSEQGDFRTEFVLPIENVAFQSDKDQKGRGS